MLSKDVVLGMRVLVVHDKDNWGKIGIVRKIELKPNGSLQLGVKFESEPIFNIDPEYVSPVIVYNPYKGDKISFPFKEGNKYLKDAVVQDFGYIKSLGKYLVFIGFDFNNEPYYTTIWSDQVIKN